VQWLLTAIKKQFIPYFKYFPKNALKNPAITLLLWQQQILFGVVLFTQKSVYFTVITVK
jgi:hypothetical protein